MTDFREGGLFGLPIREQPRNSPSWIGLKEIWSSWILLIFILKSKGWLVSFEVYGPNELKRNSVNLINKVLKREIEKKQHFGWYMKYNTVKFSLHKKSIMENFLSFLRSMHIYFLFDYSFASSISCFTYIWFEIKWTFSNLYWVHNIPNPRRIRSKHSFKIFVWKKIIWWSSF